MKEKIWDRLARQRLRFIPRSSEQVGEGRLLLRGTAAGQFMGHDYRRRITFVLTPTNGAWRVQRMELGTILTDLPDVLELPEKGGPPSQPSAP